MDHFNHHCNMNLYPSDNFVFCLKILFGSSTFHESQAWFYSGQFFMIYQSSFDSFLQLPVHAKVQNETRKLGK